MQQYFDTTNQSRDYKNVILKETQGNQDPYCNL